MDFDFGSSQENPMGAGEPSIVRAKSRRLSKNVRRAVLVAILASCNDGGPTMPTNPESGGGRSVLLQNFGLQPSYGVAIGCGQCEVKPEGPGLLEAEFRWDAGGAKYFALVLREVDPTTRTSTCGEVWSTPGGDICLGFVHEKDQSKNPWRVQYEIPSGQHEYAIDFESRGPGLPSGLLTIWFTKH